MRDSSMLFILSGVLFLTGGAMMAQRKRPATINLCPVTMCDGEDTVLWFQPDTMPMIFGGALSTPCAVQDDVSWGRAETGPWKGVPGFRSGPCRLYRSTAESDPTDFDTHGGGTECAPVGCSSNPWE